MKRRMTHYRLTLFALSTLVVTAAWLRFSMPVQSLTVTPNAVQKLTVYGGVATVTPVVGGPTLELGTDGTDIVSSGNIVIRPQSSPPNISNTRFTGGGSNVQNLLISGDLKLTTPGRQICLQGDCQSSWGGGSFWAERSGGIFPVYWLEPTDLSRGLRIGESSAFTGKTALIANGLGAYNIGGGAAARFIGDVKNINELHYFESFTVNGGEAWHEQNDGRGSGLDADNFDGVRAFYQPGTSLMCYATFCLCFEGFLAHHTSNHVNNDCLRFKVDW
ncbi:MAG: hypothetical protein HY421_01970 [Candidatus Kerfeldbacteria bacterium]|nr:hypothetical protein [Candidatus Kerfeldbacteria bacterium]